MASPPVTFSASLGTSDSASLTANRPRHSATTLRTPSSSLPALANRISSVRSASAVRSTPPLRITSRRDRKSEYWCLCDSLDTWPNMIGRNLARPPVATPPSATDAADLSSSPGTSSAPSSAASIPATADKSAALPNSPRQNSARRSFPDILAGSPSCATRDDAVDAVCFASPTPAQTAATQTAAVRPAVAAASPVFEPPFPLPISRANKSSEDAPATESFADTSAVKKDVSAWSACDCISGERTSSSAAGSVFSQTAEHAFAKGARTLG